MEGLGTLCSIDQAPRMLSEDDVEPLKDPASIVERELAAVELGTLGKLANVANRRGFMTLAEHGL